MARRKKDTPQKAALREMMSQYMAENDVHIKDGTNVNSIMRDMISIILEGTLDVEMEEELGYSKYDYQNKATENSRNGYSKKTMHTSYEDMDVEIPRDRKGEFQPQVVKKYQNTVTQNMEEKIISMYAKGMTTADIESHMRELYDIEISDSTISRITDKILPLVKEWQEHPLEEVYAVIFMDAIHYHVRREERIVKRAVSIVIGIDMAGTKDVLGFHRQLRKVTKSKSVFPSDDSLLKILYLVMMDITKKWTRHRKDWGRIYSQLEIYFEERLEGRYY